MSGSKTLRTGEPANNIKQVCAPFTSYQPFCLAVSYVHCSTLVNRKFWKRPTFSCCRLFFSSTLPLQLTGAATAHREERLKIEARNVLLYTVARGKEELVSTNAAAKQRGPLQIYSLNVCLYLTVLYIV
jgi:hypothetical protein